jgi:hypothetical protein
LDEHSLGLGISKLGIDKKSEKGWVYAQKFFVKDKIRVETDIRVRLALVMGLALLDKNWFFWLEDTDAVAAG